MLAEKAEKHTGGKIGEPFDKIVLKLDILTFSKAQTCEQIMLRVFCPDNLGSLRFILKNMGREDQTDKIGIVLDLQLDGEMFANIANPKIKVIFQCENVLAPFIALNMKRGVLFSDKEPIADGLN